MKIDGKEISKELIAKAMQCDTPEELVKLAKTEGIEMTVEQAEAYLSEMEEIDLSSEQMKQVAGGSSATCWTACESQEFVCKYRELLCNNNK